MQEAGGAPSASLAAEIREELSGRAGRRRVTDLGVRLRRLRRLRGDSLLTMAQKLAARSFGGALELAPETLAAFERGDAAPGPDFLQRLAAAYPLSAQERAACEQAAFLAADPFLRLGAEAAGDETEEEALRLLTAPIEDALEDAPQEGAALLRRRGPAQRRRTLSPAPSMLQVREAGRALRRALAQSEERIPNAALTDGVELLLETPVRVVFADQALSSAFFSGDGRLAFSGPSRPVMRADAAFAQDGPGGFVCLRAGALDRLGSGDPILRYALLHEIGRRVLGQGATPFFHERHAKNPKLTAAPGMRRRRLDKAQQDAVIGQPHPGESPPPLRAALSERAAAALFALSVLTEPETLSPAVDRLDRWAAHYGAPFAPVLSFYRSAPEFFGPAPFKEKPSQTRSKAV